MTPVIVAEQVTVKIGSKTLVDNVSLSFNPGETIAIVGPNGAGKTTMLRLLSGELRAGSGCVHLKGRPIADYPPRELAHHRAVLSQNTDVAFPFTVAEIARMGAGAQSGSRTDALADAALAETGLGKLATRIVTTLSGGERQRVHFARVLVQLACGEAIHGSGVLLLDEPTASLDLKHQIELLMLAKRHAANGVTVIAVLHDLNLATLFADRIVVMNNGRVDRDGSPAETITTSMVASVFGVSLAVGCTPPDDLPFILPQVGPARPEPNDALQRTETSSTLCR